MRLWLIPLATGLAAAGAGWSAPKPAVCKMSSEDRSWADGALKASDYIMKQRLHLGDDPHATVVLFNERCRFELPEGKSRWIGEPHSGKIRIPNGSLDARVWAMASTNEKTNERFFVMSLPSIWEAAKLATRAA